MFMFTCDYKIVYVPFCVTSYRDALIATYPSIKTLDLFMEWLVFDKSMDIKKLQKCYELCHLPAVEVKQKSEAIDENHYVIREERNALVTYQKHGNVEVYHVDCSNGSFNCRYFMKIGYCKHLLHAHTLLNEDSDYVIIDCQFK